MTEITSGFSAGAVISAGLVGHSRQHDHYGTQTDTVVVIDGPVGPWPSGTDLHTVLADMISRVTALESGNHRVMVSSVDAFILPYVRANSIVRRPDMPGSTTANAVVTATVRVTGDIPASALVVSRVIEIFRASAWLLDNVAC